ncbi:hypothetical protein ACFQX7_08395 [Luedemannella flava]
MVEAAEAAGHTCVLYLYDRYGGDLAHHEQVIREFWPGMRAEVRSVADGMVDLDAYVASAWSTAHVLASRADLRTRRLYFIQDYEPFFYPQGSEYHLAADTYRFGFRAITVGPMIAQILRDEYHVEAAVAEFGVDTAVYRLTNPNPRRGSSSTPGPRSPGAASKSACSPCASSTTATRNTTFICSGIRA